MKVGVSSNGRKLDDALFSAYKAAGVDAMEVGLYTEAEADAYDLRKVRALADRYGITLWSFHAPFWPFESFDPSSTDEAVRLHTEEYLKSLAARMSEAGIKIMVVHTGSEPIADEDRPQKMASCKKTFYNLAEYAKNLGVVIAVEDLPRTCLGRNSDEIAEIIGVHENLKVCFDTNHLLSESHKDFVEHVGADIVTLHVSDYDFVDERHWMPKVGKIDWAELISLLKAAGYGGVWMYELASEMDHLERYTENAKELGII